MRNTAAYPTVSHYFSSEKKNKVNNYVRYLIFLIYFFSFAFFRSRDHFWRIRLWSLLVYHVDVKPIITLQRRVPNRIARTNAHQCFLNKSQREMHYCLGIFKHVVLAGLDNFVLSIYCTDRRLGGRSLFHWRALGGRLCLLIMSFRC